MTKSQPRQTDSAVLAVTHRTGRGWHVLIASTRERRPSILAAQTFTTATADRIESLLEEHRVGRVVSVIPASSVICRTATLPNADPEQLDQALRLQAEAHSLGTASEHRLAMAVLPESPGETSRSGIMLTWPEAAQYSGPPTDREITYAPDVAALAALLNGLRPTDAPIWIDRSNGALAMAITHANGAVLRATREEDSSSEVWRERVMRIIAETALRVGHTGPFVESLIQTHESEVAAIGPNDAALFLPDSVIDHAAAVVDGTGDDRTWWSTYGISTGVLIAATGPLAPLTLMRRSPVVKEPSRLSTIVDALSRPRIAIATVVACVLLWALLPVVVSGMRLGILKLRHPRLGEEVRAFEAAQRKLTMYSTLDKTAWSMTKVLSDIVSNTPEGIDLDVIRASTADSSFTVNGLAKPHQGKAATELVAEMQDALEETGIFTEVKLTWGDSNAYGHYQFDISARVVRPYRRFQYAVAQDYGRWSLLDRLLNKAPPEEGEARDTTGEAATALVNADSSSTPSDTVPVVAADSGNDTTVPPAVSSPSGTRRPPRDPGRSRGGLNDGGGGGDEAKDRSNPAHRAGDGIPEHMQSEPLSEAQINAMSIEDVRQSLSNNASATGRARKAGDKELLARLKSEREWLMKRMREQR